MRDKYPLLITEAEILEAVQDLNFQFFADLIRYPQPIDPRGRELAARFVLDILTGEWGSKRERGKLLTGRRLSKMADRVSELKEENGLESAVTQAAKEFRVGTRRIWNAWEVRQERERSTQEILKKVAELGADGAPAEAGIKAVRELNAVSIKKINRILKRKG